MSQEDRDQRCLFCKLTYKLQALNTNHEPVRAVLFEGRKLVLHFLRYMIGLKNSRHFFIQSEVQPKPIVKRSHAFSPALRQLPVITSSFDWFIVLSVFFVIG